jgi:hypothetical protein
VYKKGPQFDAIAPGEDIVIDKLKGMISEVDFTIYSMEDEPQNSTEVEIRHYDERTAAKMDRVLLDLLKLPKIVVDRFYFAAMSRMQTQEHGEDAQYTHYDGDYIKESLRVINQLMQTFSVQSIDELSADMGVVNIDRYDTSDLLNLYALMHESDVSVKRREYLKQGDVTVVFCDAFGDYNRAFDPVASMYRGQLGRLLLFDVSTAEEIYRRMVQLKKHGIKPANVVIAAHGNPGTTGFGRLGKGFDFVSTAELANDKSVVLDEANLGRLASDEFMQPDKYGKRKIIIDSCSSAEEYPGVKSVAESILKSINRLDVVVYGADAVSTAGGNIDRGIKFSEYKPDSDEKARSTLVEMSLKRNDKIRTRALESLRFDERRQA